MVQGLPLLGQGLSRLDFALPRFQGGLLPGDGLVQPGLPVRQLLPPGLQLFQLPALLLPGLDLIAQGGEGRLPVFGLAGFPQQPLPLGLGGVQLLQLLFPLAQLTGPGLAGGFLVRLGLTAGLDLPVQGGQRRPLLGQLFILGQYPLQGAQGLPGFLPPGGLGLLGFQRLLGLVQPGLELLLVLDGLVQLVPGFPGSLRLAQQGGSLAQVLVQPVQLRLLAGLLGGVLADQLLHQFHRVLEGQTALLGLFQAGAEGVVGGTVHPGDVLPDAVPGLVALFLEPGGLVLYLVLEHHVVPGLKDFPENFLAAPGVGQQQFQEVPLGDHGDLGELAAVQADDPGDFPGDLPGFGDQPPVGQGQLGVGLLKDGAAAPQGGPLVLGVPADGVGLAAVGEHQLDKGGGVGPGVLGPEHGGVPVVAAGLPVEGVGDGVKQGGFAGAGVPGDQIQALGAQPVQLHCHLAGIGAKGR